MRADEGVLDPCLAVDNPQQYLHGLITSSEPGAEMLHILSKIKDKAITVLDCDSSSGARFYTAASFEKRFPPWDTTTVNPLHFLLILRHNHYSPLILGGPPHPSYTVRSALRSFDMTPEPHRTADGSNPPWGLFHLPGSAPDPATVHVS